ncbi:MAG: hypothetical protein Q9165_001221 [Trypethelium subeluteriae]
MAQSAQKNNDIETSLREHLLAAQSHSAGIVPPPEMRPAASASPNENQIDPAISGAAYTMASGDSGGDDGADASRKGKRELSTSKRAAQNRAAQRAFRQRKEGYIKQLEERVKESDALKESYRAIQAENYQLRDYIINLQSRLLESQGDYPQPPANIELSNPRSAREAEASAQHLQAQAAQAQVQAEAAEAQRRAQQVAAPPANSAIAQLQQATRDATMKDADARDNHHHEEARYAAVTSQDFTPANQAVRQKHGPSMDRVGNIRATAQQALAREMPST